LACWYDEYNFVGGNFDWIVDMMNMIVLLGTVIGLMV